jgi:steroid 5-alpha reductase family enzyme
MAIYNQGKLAGIVGYKQLYPNGAMHTFNELLTGLPRIWAIRLVSNMQNKLVGKPFYNPRFQG